MIAAAALGVFFYSVFPVWIYYRKSQGGKLFDMVSVAAWEISIPSLDYWLNKAKDLSTVFGEETLYGVTSVLRKLNLVNLKETVRHLEFVDFGDASGNVYTCLRRYINDYGYARYYYLCRGACQAHLFLVYNNIKRMIWNFTC